MHRVRSWWHRLRRHRVTLGDELPARISFAPERDEWETYPAANDNGDTLFRTVKVPHEGKAT